MTIVDVPITKDEAIELINAAGAAGVTWFKLGGLEVSYIEHQAESGNPTRRVPAATAAKLAQQTQAEEDSARAEGIDQQEQLLEELRLSDPLRYEQMLAAGEIAQLGAANAESSGS